MLVSLILAAGLLFTADSYADEKPKYISQESSSKFRSIDKQEVAKILKDKAARFATYKEVAGLDSADLEGIENTEFLDIDESFREDLITELSSSVEDDVSEDAVATGADTEELPEESEEQEKPGGGRERPVF